MIGSAVVGETDGTWIPQADPGANYLAHREELDRAVARVLGSGMYILGEENAAFEAEFSRYLGVRHAVGVASGTDALELALRCLGIGTGDAVFTVSHTASATAAAVCLSEATPVFVDIDPKTCTMDAQKLAFKINKVKKDGRLRARAVLPVHLYGYPADMDAICRIAEDYGLDVVEDCAQAHGAKYGGKMTGSLGRLGGFSFYPTKNLGALGDGGAVVTDEDALAEKLRLLRQYGWRDKYISEIEGKNSRLDELQAAVLRVKLAYLDAENERRRALAKFYTRLLAGSSLILPPGGEGVEPVYHQYVVRVPKRDSLREFLVQRGVRTGIHYPVPVHLQPAYHGFLEYADDLEVTEMMAGEILSLPMYPELGESMAERVCRAIVEWESMQ